MVTHFFKDGTNTKDLKNVYVPEELIEKLLEIQKRRREDEEDAEE